MTTTLDGLAGTELDKQLAALKNELSEEYGAARPVGRVVDEERRRFAGARIHLFLPILIERSARSRFVAAHAAE